MLQCWLGVGCKAYLCHEAKQIKMLFTGNLSPPMANPSRMCSYVGPILDWKTFGQMGYHWSTFGCICLPLSPWSHSQPPQKCPSCSFCTTGFKFWLLLPIVVHRCSSSTVVSIGLFSFSFMPFLYNGVYYQPSKNLSFKQSKWYFL